MAIEADEIVKVTDKTAIHLHEYKGKYSLDVATLGGNSTWYSQWVFKSQWKDGKPVPDETKRVMGVYLGDRETAVKALRAILSKLDPRSEGGQDVDDSDVPF
jgi:hypothetical protein